MAMATMILMMAMLVTVMVMMTMRLNFYHPNSTRGGVATAVSEHAAHTNTWPYHARIRSTPKLALRRGAEARPARSRRMASAERRRWQSLAQPLVCSSYCSSRSAAIAPADASGEPGSDSKRLTLR